MRARLLALPLLLHFAATTSADDALLTVAEKSDFQATARHDDVLALCRALDERFDAVRLEELGVSGEGRSIPLLVVTNPGIKSPSQARASDRLVVLLIGNIHAGEVCGKEALLMLVRDLVEAGDDAKLLDDLVLLVVPNLNPDGNERVSPGNRPGQVGPAAGMGQRGNAANLDLNRDFVKLQTPEVQALVSAINAWDPHLVIDTHTTNGSLHRYVLTYQGPQNPAGDPRVIQYVRETLLPAVDREFEARSGRQAYFYGDFSADHKQWTGYPDMPRFGTNYVGMRNRIALLSEAYAYAPYKDRVQATRDFTRTALDFAANHKQEIASLLEEARTKAGSGEGEAEVSISSKPGPLPAPEAILGYVEELKDGKPTAGEPRDYPADVLLDYRPSRTVKRPYAYLVPARFDAAIENLRRHGLTMERLRESVTLDTSTYVVENCQVNGRPYQDRSTLTIDAADNPIASTRMIEAGTVLVPTSQPLGNLACYLLEPDSEDGLALWNFLGDDLEPGDEFPLLRLETAPAFGLLTSVLPPLPQEQPEQKRLSFETTLSGVRPNFYGSPTSGSWIDDEHYLVTRDRKLQKVEARTGQMSPFYDESALARALATLPTIDEERAKDLARLNGLRFDAGHGSLFAPRSQSTPLLSSDHQMVLFTHQNDLYLVALDGSSATRLTSSPGQEEFPEFSPDGKFVAFVRDNDLFVIDTATATERALTTGGTDQVRHGKADWVYYEEIFNRNWKAFWWSPDSKRVAFMEFDDRPIGNHVVLNDAASPRVVEETPYPRAGEPNPHVRLGIVPAAGGEVSWADTADYTKDSFIISGVGWWADGSATYCYAQNRTQSWLDLLKVSPDGDTERLFRETTGAWVENPGNLIELKDGDFLFPSERTGWKHLYRYSPDGQTCKALTTGQWEVESLEAIDQEDGWIYFTASKEGTLADHLYRVPLEGGEVQRLTSTDATHSAKVSPAGSLFLDTYSSRQSPPRVALLETDGDLVRMVDENPVPAVEEYDLAPSERFQIPARDGFLLEAELTLPHKIEPDTLYPVWFMTYGGPHMPTVSDGWPGGRLLDQALATEGFVAFRVDPRSASGKGASSAHTAYKQLGVQELQDIEDAIEWLKREKPFVDGSRIGMAGHSYGGYMTAYAMTHSKLFAAGIAGAPVTDWRDYDSIYTERYMLTPQENPEGYKASSVVEAAANLHGRLLIAHGAIDDNVSLRNTMRLVHALQRADKDFELMLYPSSRHGIFGSHYTRLQLDFIKRVLGGPKKTEAAAN